MTFSEKLITLRAGRSWSQERLAEELGVTRQAVGRWEKGAGLPDAMSLTRLAMVFDVAPEWLLDEAAPDEPQPRRQGRARAEWFDYLAFALVLLILVLNYALSAKLAERFKYYGYTPLMVFWLVALRPLGWLAAGWAVSALAICAGRMPPPAKRVRLLCAVLGALPLLAYVLSAALSFGGVRALELVFFRLFQYHYVLAVSGLLLGLAAKRRERCRERGSF